MNVIIPSPADVDRIRQIHLQAFGEEERELVGDLAVELLIATSEPPTLHLVAEVQGKLVGHVAFSPVRAKADKEFLGYILCPLGVMPENQKVGVGTALVKAGLEKLSGSKTDAIFVYGDPQYYGRFGFKAESAVAYHPPYPLQYPEGWLATVPKGQKLPVEPLDMECLEALGKPELW